MLVDQDLQDEIRLATRFFQKKKSFPSFAGEALREIRWCRCITAKW